MSETLKNCPYCGEEGLLLKKECGGYLGCIKDESCREKAKRAYVEKIEELKRKLGGGK